MLYGSLVSSFVSCMSGSIAECGSLIYQVAKVFNYMRDCNSSGRGQFIADRRARRRRARAGRSMRGGTINDALNGIFARNCLFVMCLSMFLRKCGPISAFSTFHVLSNSNSQFLLLILF